MYVSHYCRYSMHFVLKYLHFLLNTTSVSRLCRNLSSLHSILASPFITLAVVMVTRTILYLTKAVYCTLICTHTPILHSTVMITYILLVYKQIDQKLCAFTRLTCSSSPEVLPPPYSSMFTAVFLFRCYDFSIYF